MDAHRNIHSGKHHYLIVSLVVTILIGSLFFSVVIKSEENKDKNIISCTVYFEYPRIIEIELNNSIYTRIEIPGCVNHGESGEPSLPIYSAQILIPFDKEIKDINIFYDDWEFINYDFQKNPIIPEQELLPFSCNAENVKFKINKSAYKSYQPLHKEVYKIGEIGYCRGYKIQTVYLYPIKYIPKPGLLSYLSEIRIDVELYQDAILSNENSFLRFRDEDKILIDDIVENSEDLDYYDNIQVPMSSDSPFEYCDGLCDPLDNYDYVIITSNSLKDTSGDYNWSDLINHRQSFSSLSATIVTVEDISACSTYWNDTALYNDTQAHMREFCKDAYQDWGTEYVLIGGDWGTSSARQCVPFRLFEDRYETLTYDTMASELYFSNLDGDFYYSGSGGMWGGGENSGVNDLYSELYVGRITAYNDTMVSNAVKKIINYDTNNNYDSDWLRAVSFWGGDLDWISTSKQYMEELRLGSDTYRTFTGFEEWNNAKPEYEINTDQKLYHADLGEGYKTYMSNCAEDDNASIVNHLDHSGWSTPFGLTGWQYRYNTKPFFGYTQGCLAGRYHSGYSGCEQMMCRHDTRHAFALVLNTGYGYGASSSTNGASQYLNAFFWDYFFNNQSENQQNWQIGKAMAYAHDKMASVMNSKSHAWCYAWYSANLFGDPAQTLRLNGANPNSAVSYSNEYPSDGSTEIPLTLSEVNIRIEDPEGSSFNWSIETYPDIGSNSGNNQNNGTKSCSISGLSYSTSYTWFVNTTDGNSWNNESYTFTTRSIYQPLAPGSISANAVNRFKIDLSWIDDSKADSTRVEWSSIDDQSWNRGDHNILYNGSAQSTSKDDLQPGSTIYFKAWSYNISDGVWSSSSSVSETTLGNSVPVVDSESPSNGSVDNLLDLTFSVDIFDSEGDSFNYSFECSNGQSNSSNDCSNGTMSLILSNLDYLTLYTVWVNVTDFYDSVCYWFSFTTMEEIHASPIQNYEFPNNGDTNIELLPTLSIVCNDSDTEYLNSYFYSNSSGNWQLFGKNLSFLSGSNLTQVNLNFSNYYTTYYWSVNLTDGLNWDNATYCFTTREENVPSTPQDFTANTVNRFEINISWNKGLNSDRTIVEYNTISDWTLGQGTLIYNDTGEYVIHDSLNPGSFFYYQTWSYNNTDNCFSSSFASSNSTTNSNNPPSILDLSPDNNSENVVVSLDNVRVDITDLDGDNFNYTIEGRYINNTSENFQINGTKYANISSTLPYNSLILWYVNITDSYENVDYIFYFTTIEEGIPNPPFNCLANTYNRTQINLSWQNYGENISYLEFNTTNNWDRGEGIELYNGTNQYYYHMNLSFATKYYYQIWSYNITYNKFSNTFHSFNESTNANTAPVYSEISPSNGSTGVSNSLSQLSIMINDNDSDLFDWNISTSPDIGNNSGLNSSNATKTCLVSGLSYSTTYYWTVKTFDSYNWTIETYHFTTRSRPSGGGGGSPSPPPAEEEEEENETEEPGDQNQTEDNDIINQTEDNDNEDTNDSIVPPIEEEIEEENEELTDSDNDGVPDIVEEEFSEDVVDSDSIEEIVINEENNYLIDSNNDGRFDKYINVKEKIKTKVEYFDENTILIDENNDDVWDYQYDLSTRSISSYVGLAEKEENKSNFSFNIWYLFGGIILLFTCIFFVFRKKLSLFVTDYRLSRVNTKLEHMKHHRFAPDSHNIHFFLKDKDKKHLVKHVKNVKKAKKEKTYYYHDSRDKDILISNRPSFADISPSVSNKSVYNAELDFNVDKVILSKINVLNLENYKKKTFNKDQKLKEIEEKIDKFFI